MNTDDIEQNYLAAQRSFVALARDLSADDWAAPVPCCPGWTVRDVLSHAAPGWLAVAVFFELLSCASYVLMFRPVFCRRVS